jgi:hypothetical protein
MSINELFAPETNETTANARTLSGTAELTRIAGNIASNIIRSMEDDIDNYRARIPETAADSKKLDELLDEFRPWVDIEDEHPLRYLSDETVESMLKSQQSKRSRCKSKEMTLDNYRSLLTAAIAENLLRELYDKPKSAAFGNRRTGTLDYTPAELEMFADDQEALRKEIRNVQSKKSIMKSKANFDESSEQWQQLLKAEQMLKDLRGSGQVIEVDRVRDTIAEKLDGIDLEHIKAADAKELLASIMGVVQSNG